MWEQETEIRQANNARELAAEKMSGLKQFGASKVQKAKKNK